MTSNSILVCWSGLRILKGVTMDTRSPDWLTVESQTSESAVVRHCSQIDALYRIISTEGYHHLSAGGCRPLVVTRICGDRGRPTAIVLSVQDSKSCGEGFVRLYENVGARFKFAGRAQSLIRTKLACELHEHAFGTVILMRSSSYRDRIAIVPFFRPLNNLARIMWCTG